MIESGLRGLNFYDMKKKIKQYLLKLCYILPVFVAILGVYYFDNWHEKSMMKVVQRQYYEKIEFMSQMLHNIETLHRQCTSYEKNELFNNFIINTVEEIDKQYGIYARVVDLDGRRISEPYVADGEGELAILLDAPDFDFDSELGFIKDIPKGDRHIVSRNGVKIHLHWLRYPTTEEHYYYILLGIVYDRVIDTIDYKAFAFGYVFVLLVLVVSLFIMIFQANKIYKLKLKE